MPPIIIAFWIALSAALGPPLIKGLDPRADAIARPKFGNPVPQGYRTWLSRVSPAAASGGVCDTVLFAMANRNRVVRVRLDGVEQSLGSGFASPVVGVKAGTRRHFKAEYLAPIGGEILACHDVSLSCYGQAWAELEDVREVEPCSESRVPKHGESGKPHLVGKVPHFRLYDVNLGGAEVEVEFALRGVVTEEYYCPRIEITWPDDTRTEREGDCPPFVSHRIGDGEQPPPTRWSFTRIFPTGEWPVTACIYKVGKKLACESVIVRVMGG